MDVTQHTSRMLTCFLVSCGTSDRARLGARRSHGSLIMTPTSCLSSVCVVTCLASVSCSVIESPLLVGISILSGVMHHVRDRCFQYDRSISDPPVPPTLVPLPFMIHMRAGSGLKERVTRKIITSLLLYSPFSCRFNCFSTRLNISYYF